MDMLPSKRIKHKDSSRYVPENRKEHLTYFLFPRATQHSRTYPRNSEYFEQNLTFKNYALILKLDHSHLSMQQ